MAGIGVLGGGGAVVTSTGAFTSVEADRDVAVQVASDANAYLLLNTIGPNAPYTETSNGKLGIDLTEANATEAGGAGVNADAVTVFEELIEVGNQGTQEVDVSITPATLVETESGDVLLVLFVPQTEFPSTTLSTGGAETYSLVVAAYPGEVGTDADFDEAVTISGEAV
ncbi:DUF1102 domain-containing protein [Haloplanus sp.]|uniref:DUF1102 domain-containing protein n=1 Tax=Haloplanus sp. TaxID=1961696 RepID=UPI00261CF203|nr:DUF1102 domain-containing protein [Haloplanus sp.]